jgi:hypothetical protein
MTSAWRIAAAILLPFRPTFRRLELEKRWWHRLCLVAFFGALSTIFAAVAGLSYSTLAPQTSEPTIWITVDPSEVSGVTLDFSKAQPIPQRPKTAQTAPETIPFGQEKSDSARQTLKSGDPIPADAQVGKYGINDIDPGEKSVEMPDGKTVKFPGSMSDDAIKIQWTNAQHHQMLTAIFWAALLAILSALILSYAVQAAYRALLYVVFGAPTVTASDSKAN